MLKSKNLLSITVLGIALISGATCYAECMSEDTRNECTHNAIAIRMALKDGLPSKNVDAHVNDNIIQFSGFVDNRCQYEQVQQIAEKYPDYKIINNVKILSKRDNPNDEEKLRASVISQLKDSKYPIDDIDVQVRNGHVILSGFVNKHIRVNEVKAVTKNVPGVTRVDNYLLYKA